MNKDVKDRLKRTRWKENKSKLIKVIIGNREMNESRLKSRKKAQQKKGNRGMTN